MSSFSSRRTVEFSDTDMGGVVHFSRYFIFMETAEHAFLRSHGIDVHTTIGGRVVSWPRVETTCSYSSPARFRDELEIRVSLERRGTKSLTYGFTFLRDGKEIARGRTTAVCCAIGDDGVFQAIPLPDEIARRLPEAGGDTRP